MSGKCFPAARMRAFIVFAVLPWAVALGQLQARADLEGPSIEDRRITQTVIHLMKSEHLSRRDLDDEIGERFLNSFLKTLDLYKLYFYQADVDSFRSRQKQMVDEVRKGNIQAGYTIFNTFLRRIDERVKVIDELLAVPHDFTVDEHIVRDPDQARYPTTPDEARDLWRRRIKYDLLDLKAKKTEAQAAIDKLSRRYHSFARRMHQTDRDELLEMYLTSLTTAYDPHSTYMSPGSLENFTIQMRLNLDGIGAQLSSEDGYTVVHKVIPGGAADKDGRLKPKDQIIGVGQGPDGEIVDTVDMKLSDVVDMIRGKQGTIVRLQVIPVNESETRIYNITRARIELTDSEARGEVIEQKRDGRTYRVGVIDLPSFYMDMDGARRGDPDFKSTTRDVRRLLDGFRRQNVDALILDLRRNGGGSLTEAINLTGLFIDEGPVVQVKDKDGRTQHYSDLEKGTAWDGPLVVLTSKFSASASEILAGAIQDYGRGLIVGDVATHGKGTVQSLLDLGRQLFPALGNYPQLGALKITMQQFYRPNGDSTQNRGVHADVVLPSLTSQLDIGEGDLDYALQFDKIGAVPFKKLNMIDPAMVERLSAASSQRCAGSTDFQKVLRDIERYHEQKSRKFITLHEEKFLAERKELNADKQEEEQLEELDDPHRPIVKRDHYFNECLDVTLDYLELVQLAHVRLSGGAVVQGAR